MTTMENEVGLVKEFWPIDPDSVLSAGRLIIKSADFASGLDKFDMFFETAVQDAATFEPPLTISREDAEIVQYAGESYKHIFGLEVAIPQGHTVSQEYTRVDHTDLIF